MTSSPLRQIASLFPVLTRELRKGDCGKICVIGGSSVYTGAPYFTSITPMKIGADLVYVHCHPDAAPTLKSYSPELIVHPSLEFDEIQESLKRVDAAVFGPGIGRDKSSLVPLLKSLINAVKKSPKLCLVIDADGLFLLSDCLDELRNTPNVILTPNHREFERLYEQVFGPDSDKDLTERVRKLAENLGVFVFYKGDNDIISNGRETKIGQTETSLRRCGGQGDILGGTIALFVFWSKLKANESDVKSDHIFEGALAASDFQRITSLRTFKRMGRSMNASDILDEIQSVVKEIDSFKSSSP